MTSPDLATTVLSRALVRIVGVDWSDSRTVLEAAEHACSDEELAAIETAFGSATIGEILAGHD